MSEIVEALRKEAAHQETFRYIQTAGLLGMAADTIARSEAALATARDDALDEAAGILTERAANDKGTTMGDWLPEKLNKLADQIRSLKSARITAEQKLDAAQAQAYNDAIEQAARFAEGGSFFHENAPDAQWAKSCAKAIRRLIK